MGSRGKIFFHFTYEDFQSSVHSVRIFQRDSLTVYMYKYYPDNEIFVSGQCKVVGSKSSRDGLYCLMHGSVNNGLTGRRSMLSALWPFITLVRYSFIE